MTRERPEIGHLQRCLNDVISERDRLASQIAGIRHDPFRWLVAGAVQPPRTLRFRKEPIAGLVSAIVPAYKGRSFIERCFRSLWSQSGQGFQLEIVVCDDGSPDDTAGFARELAADSPVPVTVVSHPGGINKGVGPTRNVCMQESQGEFLALLDVDDTWLPQKTARQTEYFRAHPETGCLCSFARHVDPNSNPVRGWADTEIAGDYGSPGPYTFAHLLTSDPIINSTVMMRRSAVERAGGYTEVMAYQAEDWLLFQKMALMHPVHLLPEVLSEYTIHQAGYTSRYISENLELSVRFETFYQLLHWMLQSPEHSDMAHAIYRQEFPGLLAAQSKTYKVVEEYVSQYSDRFSTLADFENYLKNKHTRPQSLVPPANPNADSASRGLSRLLRVFAPAIRRA